jgi:hypothetical protein
MHNAYTVPVVYNKPRAAAAAVKHSKQQKNHKHFIVPFFIKRIIYLNLAIKFFAVALKAAPLSKSFNRKALRPPAARGNWAANILPDGTF